MLIVDSVVHPESACKNDDDDVNECGIKVAVKNARRVRNRNGDESDSKIQDTRNGRALNDCRIGDVFEECKIADL